MSTQRSNPMTRDAVERLLDGGRTGHDALARVLAAAAATAHPRELLGEHASIVAFRAARLVPATQPRSKSMMKTAVMKLLTVKAAAIFAGVAATGGIALAASSGALPEAFTTKQPAATASGSAHGKSQADQDAEAKAQASKDKSAKADKDGPSPSLVGLCRAFAAGNKADHGKALENPAFGALIEAAGSKDKVEGYCTLVLASAKPETDKSEHPKGGASDRPNGATSARPHGKPSDSPTG